MEKTAIVHGSVKNKIVSSDLQNERNNRDFQVEPDAFIKNINLHNDFDMRNKIEKEMQEDPILRSTHKYYDMTR